MKTMTKIEILDIIVGIGIGFGVGFIIFKLVLN